MNLGLDLTLAKTLNIAATIEAVEQQLKEMSITVNSSNLDSVNSTTTNKFSINDDNNRSMICGRCGRRGHFLAV